jgi:hypothetical protein
MDNKNDDEPDIESMQTALSYLKALVQNPNEEYNNICKLMEEYIIHNCNHNIVEDSIDITPDRSQTIFYCSKCMKSFEKKST